VLPFFFGRSVYTAIETRNWETVVIPNSQLMKSRFAILGQREGSPLRFDVFLPRHVRAEYELGPRLRGALGIEVVGNTWIVHAAGTELRARRAGGAIFGELQLAASELVRVEARAGVSVDRYTLPAMAGGTTVDQPLRAAAFAQLAVIVAP